MSNPTRMPLSDVPPGSVILGPGGRLFYATIPACACDHGDVRPVLDYSGNLEVLRGSAVAPVILVDWNVDGALAQMDPEHLWLSPAWQYHVN